MSCNSGESSCENRGKGGGGCHEIPSTCHCGLDVIIYTSTTKQNPGRPFFRYPSRRDNHLFKWVEDSVYEEVVDAKTMFADAESEVALEIEALKAMIEELKEDRMWSKREIKKLKLVIKLCLVCLGLIGIAIAIAIIMCKTKNQKLVLGY